MRKLIPVISVALCLGPASAAAAFQDREAELASALGDRVAGEPVNCIDLSRVRSTRVITGTAILYTIGSTIYVNRPDNGAESLNRWDTLATRNSSSRLCNSDTVRMVDMSSRMQRGVVFLGDFVPYSRPGN